MFDHQLRDRPFNLQGGYGFLFRSEILFGQHESSNIFFFPEINIMLYDKKNIFFSNIGNQNIFLEK